MDARGFHYGRKTITQASGPQSGYSRNYDWFYTVYGPNQPSGCFRERVYFSGKYEYPSSNDNYWRSNGRSGFLYNLHASLSVLHINRSTSCVTNHHAVGHASIPADRFRLILRTGYFVCSSNSGCNFYFCSGTSTGYCHCSSSHHLIYAVILDLFTYICRIGTNIDCLKRKQYHTLHILGKPKDSQQPLSSMNCPPLVRQYGILNNK